MICWLTWQFTTKYFFLPLFTQRHLSLNSKMCILWRAFSFYRLILLTFQILSLLDTFSFWSLVNKFLPNTLGVMKVAGGGVPMSWRLIPPLDDRVMETVRVNTNGPETKSCHASSFFKSRYRISQYCTVVVFLMPWGSCISLTTLFL